VSNGKQKKCAVLLLCSLSIIAFILACQLSVATASYEHDGTRSLTETILGDSRIAISAQFYTQADVYFHRGVPHKKQQAFDADPFQKIHNVVCPTKHVHLSGATDIQEIMPWLDMSIRANPLHVDSYLVAAFWLSREANLNEQALEVLARAQRNIPDSYKVQMAKGRVFLHTEEFTLAKHSFNAAMAFWNKTADKTTEAALLDKSEILLYRALLYEDCGMTHEAIADIRNMLSISPNNPMMQKRLKNLQSGAVTQPSAHDLLASISNKHNKQCRKCKHEGHDNEKHELPEKYKHDCHDAKCGTHKDHT